MSARRGARWRVSPGGGGSRASVEAATFTRKLRRFTTAGFPSVLLDASSTNKRPSAKAAVAVRLRALKYSSKSRFAVLLERRFFYNFCSSLCTVPICLRAAVRSAAQKESAV